QSDGALAQARGRTAESAMRAPADVYEDQEGLTLVADMPGVSRERLDVRVDGDKLLLEGSVQFELPEQAEALYADVRSTLYRRSFSPTHDLPIVLNQLARAPPALRRCTRHRASAPLHELAVTRHRRPFAQARPHAGVQTRFHALLR